MAKQTISIGTAANDGTGDTLRDSFDICNDNFTENYDSIAVVEGSIAELVPTATAGTVVTFDTPKQYGTTTTPETGNITFSFTSAALWVVGMVVHNNGTEPTYPTEAKLLNGSQSYAPSVDNYIFFMYLDANHVLYHIQNEA